MTEPYFEWDEENGLAICAIWEGSDVYVGTSSVAIEDEDMKSEKVGCEIAFRRARINYFKGQKIKYKEQLKSLRHFKSTLSKNINTNDYIYKRLLKEIKNRENKIIYYCNKIDFEKNRLREYINDKEEFYQYIRKKRQVKND